MSRFDYRSLSGTERNKLFDELSEMLLSLKTKQDMRQFLQRLLTPSEMVMLIRRVHVAKSLIKGKSYDTIREELGVGFSTIQSIDQWLTFAIGDYEAIRAKQQRSLKEHKRRQTSNRRRSRDMPGSFDDVRHRYGAKFLLINLLLDGLGK